MKQLIFIFYISISLILGCCPNKEKEEPIKPLKIGIWRGVLKPQEIEIPFIFQVEENEGNYAIKLINAEEKIPLDEVVMDND